MVSLNLQQKSGIIAQLIISRLVQKVVSCQALVCYVFVNHTLVLNRYPLLANLRSVYIKFVALGAYFNNG